MSHKLMGRFPFSKASHNDFIVAMAIYGHVYLELHQEV